MEQLLSGLTLDDGNESDAECPKCGLLYSADEENLWVCCDKCSSLVILSCTNSWLRDLSAWWDSRSYVPTARQCLGNNFFLYMAVSGAVMGLHFEQVVDLKLSAKL